MISLNCCADYADQTFPQRFIRLESLFVLNSLLLNYNDYLTDFFNGGLLNYDLSIIIYYRPSYKCSSDKFPSRCNSVIILLLS